MGGRHFTGKCFGTVYGILNGIGNLWRGFKLLYGDQTLKAIEVAARGTWEEGVDGGGSREK